MKPRELLVAFGHDWLNLSKAKKRLFVFLALVYLIVADCVVHVILSSLPEGAASLTFREFLAWHALLLLAIIVLVGYSTHLAKKSHP